MGVCLSGSYCKDQISAINVHRSIGFENQSSTLINSNSKINFIPKYSIQDIGYKIKINLIFFCNDNILKNSYTYKFQLFIDNSDIEEENFISLGSTESMICQNKIKYEKNFEAIYFFSKGQRIKICCLENEKNINTSLFYLGKMINGFENPKLIIEKDNDTIGELLILINRDDNTKLFKNKKCLFSVELSNKVKALEEGNFFFIINNSNEEIIYKSEEFNYNKNENQDFIYRFNFEIRKHFIFYKRKSISFNLYKNKSIKNNININEENKINENIQKENIIEECELIGTVNITNEELLNNHGVNSFKLSSGILSALFKELIIINISYKETDYTPFLEYIKFQLHLNLIVVLDNDTLKDNSEEINLIINIFFSILSLYNNEEQKIIYTKLGNNPILKKANNYKEIFNNEINSNELKDNNSKDKIIPVIELIFKGYIYSEIDKGINKYFIVLIFNNKKFIDINDNLNIIENYENSPLNIKVFNLGDQSNYIETNNINMNIYNNINGNIKYERLLFQFYNISKQINKKEKGTKYLNDIPFLVEDFFEIQKSAKFSIFD